VLSDVSIRRRVVNALNGALGMLDVKIVRKSEADKEAAAFWQAAQPSFEEGPLPIGAEQYLRYDNPRLSELRKHFRALDDPAVYHSQWTNEYVGREIDLRFFRGDNAYVWQRRAQNSDASYALVAHYIQTIDRLGLLRSLSEDGQFGAYVVEAFADLPVTRDLLDSIVEIYFLERHLEVSRRSHVGVLDIGAGYGRLAHRMVAALPNIVTYLCTDAIPESTFIAEYYLRHRGVDPPARAVPLDDVEGVLTATPIDIAVNVHSFSECSVTAISGWLELLRRHQVRYLMIVPNRRPGNGTVLLSREPDGTMREFQPLLEDAGYRLLARDPKYLDPIVQRHGVSPTFHYLFELTRWPLTGR
jgi:putative sugar O-methyltransferase